MRAFPLSCWNLDCANKSSVISFQSPFTFGRGSRTVEASGDTYSRCRMTRVKRFWFSSAQRSSLEISAMCYGNLEPIGARKVLLTSTSNMMACGLCFGQYLSFTIWLRGYDRRKARQLCAEARRTCSDPGPWLPHCFREK